MKIYISLPISGEVYEIQRKYARKAKELLQTRYPASTVVTPFEIVIDPSTPYNQCMGKCIGELLTCTHICLIGEWYNSKGCEAEVKVAQTYKIEIIKL